MQEPRCFSSSSKTPHRRPRPKATKSGLGFSDVKVNFPSMEATRKGQPVALTLLEFKTLKYAQNARRVISRDERLNDVWGCENYPCTHTVDNLILDTSRTRKRPVAAGTFSNRPRRRLQISAPEAISALNPVMNL
jgi:DNA-binding response OmpR family regulator